MKESNLNDTRAIEHREHIRAHFCSVRCISWSAILMGTLVAISLSFLLDLLGFAIGFSAFPTEANGQIIFGVSGFVALVIGAFLSMFPAGWVAGLLGRSHCLRRKTGELYGLGTWGLALIVGIILASYTGAFFAQTNFVITHNEIPAKFATAANKMAYEPTKKIEQAADLKTTPADTTTLGMISFVTFFIFFIGALSCCFGGRLGMTYRRGTMLVSDYCAHCHCRH